MKSKQLPIIFAVLTATLLSFQANAKIWRVNNTSNYNGTTLYGNNLGGTISYPVFAQIADAVKSNLVSVNGGDTLHVEGTNIEYRSATINKKLIIIGTGYFLNENPDVSNTVMEAEVSNLVFGAGSEASQLLGIHISSSFGINILVSNIVIKRCKIDYSISVDNDISDIFILQNYFSNTANNTISAIDASSFGFPSNLIFNNNICRKTFLISSGTKVFTIEQCNNNVFDCPAISGKPSIEMNTASFKNNILKSSSASVSLNTGVASTNVAYNISTSETNQFGVANNNIVIQDMTSLFVDPSGNSTDGRYQLSPGSSPGADGTQRGPFGGLAVSNHYTLSGLAPIPVIYNVNTAGVAGSAGLQVTIKARTIK